MYVFLGTFLLNALQLIFSFPRLRVVYNASLIWIRVQTLCLSITNQPSIVGPIAG